MLRVSAIHRWLIGVLVLLLGSMNFPAWGQTYGTLHKGAACYRIHTTTYQSPITNDQSPLTNRQSPMTNHQSSITNHQSPITNYNFRSTSTGALVVSTAYAPHITDPCATTVSIHKARRSDPWDDDYDDEGGDLPTGVIDDPAPIGEPLVLLLFALLFLLLKNKKRMAE